MRTDGDLESSTTRMSTRMSAGKVDTIDSLASKIGIRPPTDDRKHLKQKKWSFSARRKEELTGGKSLKLG